VLQEEVALNDLRDGLRLRESVLTDAEDRLLVRVIPLTPEHKFLAGRLDLHDLAQRVHVANDLLEIRGGHGNDARKLDRGDRDVSDIHLNEIEIELCHHLFLTVHDLDTELGGVVLAHVQNDALVVTHRLHELEEVDHVDADDLFLGAVELVEAIGLETEVDQDRVSAVHRHDLESRAVDFEIGFCQDIFDGFHQSSEGGGLDGADPEEHVGGVHSIGWWRLRV